MEVPWKFSGKSRGSVKEEAWKRHENVVEVSWKCLEMWWKRRARPMRRFPQQRFLRTGVPALPVLLLRGRGG